MRRLLSVGLAVVGLMWFGGAAGATTPVGLPAGCVSVNPTISVITMLWQGHNLLGSQARTTGITCSTASGYSPVTTYLIVQQETYGFWGSHAQTQLATPSVPGVLDSVCKHLSGQCVAGWARRAEVEYILTNLATGKAITVRLYSSVQPPLA